MSVDLCRQRRFKITIYLTKSGKEAMYSLLFILSVILISSEGRQVVHITLDHEENFGIQDTDHVIAKRSAGWSAGLDDPNKDWEVKYDAKPTKKITAAVMEDDYEVKQLEDTSYSTKIRRIALIPGCILGGIFFIFLYYQFCVRKKIICCNFTRMAQKKVDKYVPGMIVKEGGEVSYYEITEKEREALHDLAGACQ